MASNKFKTIPITKPEDYQLVYHSNQHGQIWLDAKDRQMNQPQSSYHKPSYKSYGNKQQYNGHKPYHKSHHSKGKYRHNTRINELGDCTSDASSCSDQSDVEEGFDQQEPPTSDNSKN